MKESKKKKAVLFKEPLTHIQNKNSNDESYYNYTPDSFYENFDDLLINSSINQNLISSSEDKEIKQSSSSKNLSKTVNISKSDSGIVQSDESLNSQFNDKKIQKILTDTKSAKNKSNFLNERTQFNLLTANELQHIIDFYKRKFEANHISYENDNLKKSHNMKRCISVNSLNSYKLNPAYTINESYKLISCFGCSLEMIQKKNGGLILPILIEFMIFYLMKNGISHVGVFRKSGVKSRILKLRKHCDFYYNLNHNHLFNLNNKFDNDQKSPNQNPGFFMLSNIDELFTEFSIYDIADTIKTWLREIKPKPLISNNIILAFIDYVNELSTKEEFFFNVVSLLTDCERYTLFIILNMLSWFSINSELNQMNVYNLSICLAPSLCEMVNVEEKTLAPKLSKKNKYFLNIDLSNTELTSSADSFQKAHKCLEFLIQNFFELQFFKPSDLAFPLEMLSNNEKLLNKYENNILVNASPNDILQRLLYERNLLDPTIIEWEINNENTVEEKNDLFIMKKQISIFIPVKTVTLKRKWDYLDKNYTTKCFKKELSNKSMLSKEFFNSKYESTKNSFFPYQNIILKEEGFMYQSVYNIFANNKGKSLVHQSVLYDLKGYSFFWYQNIFPSIIDYELQMLKNSFHLDSLNLKNVRSSNI